MKSENDSDDDVPLCMRFRVKQLTKPLSEGSPMGSSDSEDEKPLALRHKLKSPNESFLMDNEDSEGECHMYNCPRYIWPKRVVESLDIDQRMMKRG